MTINWATSSPASALVGGVLIGIAVAMLLVIDGRVAGISGIIGGLLRLVRKDIGWRVAFLFGLIAAPSVYSLFAQLPLQKIDASTIAVIAAGLLVGLGTRYGAGCTSGHGVCGISRGSARSFLATVIFMGAGVMTVYLMRHLW